MFKVPQVRQQQPVCTNSLEGAALKRMSTEQTRSVLNQLAEGQTTRCYDIESGQIPFQGLAEFIGKIIDAGAR